MFDVQVRFLVGGRPVPLNAFVDSLAAHIADQVRSKIKDLPQERPAIVKHQWRERPDSERRGSKPLAVGISEAGKLLGLSPWTIRRYISNGRLQAVRVGKRVLVSMEVLEKVIVEGVPSVGPGNGG